MKANKLSIWGLSLLLGTMALPSHAQVVSNDNEDEVYKVNARMANMDYREGEVLVKFKSGSAVQVKRRANGRFQSSGVSSVDALLSQLGAEEMEELMPRTGAKMSQHRVKSFAGTEVKDKNLGKLYRLKISADKQMSVQEAIEQLEASAEVEYAEPNYKVYIMSDDDYTLEPLFSQLWGVQAINMPSLWRVPKISQKRPVIAILDTGIDITHPDLAANIWTNTAEAEGEEGYDNDNNGFKSDVHGWDFINQTGKIRDNNGHGTHCAGIAAAIGNNRIGVTGANPDALIMPVTIMQSDGTGDIATIIKGVDYAVAMGADVLSMSIGTYASSAAFKEALGKAYQTAILVAAAGNDGLCLNHAHPERGQMAPMPMFPAAYNFVLGVQASAASGAMAGFSNYDDDGAFFSAYGEDELYNYELRAPGASILSTWLLGNYRSLNGTSMACPLVAGALSRLIQCKEIDSKEELFGDLIHSKTLVGDLDIYKAYQMNDENRQPTLSFVTYTIDDGEGNKDGRPDAGETIAIYPTLRNDWGTASNIQLSIELGDMEDPNIVEFLDENAAFGGVLSSYAKNISVNPLRLKIGENVANERHIKLKLKATCAESNETYEKDFVIIVDNMRKVSGMITEDMTLTADHEWFVSSSLAIPEGKTLTIEPGTTIRFNENAGISNAGTLIADGTPEKPIIMIPNETGYWNGITNATLRYCKLTHFQNTSSTSSKIRRYFENCILSDFTCNNGTLISTESYKKVNIIEAFAYNFFSDWSNSIRPWVIENCNVVHFNKSFPNTQNGSITFNSQFSHPSYMINWINSFQKDGYYMGYHSETPITINEDSYPYYGTGREDLLRPYIYELGKILHVYNTSEYTTYSWFDLTNMRTEPVAEAHGIVWKVVVNGYDAQDEFEQLPPLGVGRHKFEVYFNRPMNKAVAPQISFGVREPYTQQVVAEDGCWNEEGTIYTAYKTITGKTMSDGLNRIYVYGAEDNEFFEIPYEKTRFNINIQAAGSMATGFAAEAGLGRVNLTWNNSENNFDDAMGFNIYRYTEETIDNPTRINEDIVDIETTEYTDYNVTPGTTYYYMYKVLSTDLQEYDVSNVVAVTPLTGELGDANGSGEVDVADVITTVNYAAGQQPKPFIFEAADMNSDLSIDILDVIGIIKKIMNPSAEAKASVAAVATYTVEDGIVYVDSPVEIAGVQIQLATSAQNEIRVAEDMRGFEHTSAWLSDNDYLFLGYNMNGKTLSAGKHAILIIGDAQIADIRLSDAYGHNIMTESSTVDKIDRMARDVMTVSGIYDLQGRKLSGKATDLQKLPKGVYIVNGQKVIK